MRARLSYIGEDSVKEQKTQLECFCDASAPVFLPESCPIRACPFGELPSAKSLGTSLQPANHVCGSACLSDYGSLRVRRSLEIWTLSPADAWIIISLSIVRQ